MLKEGTAKVRLGSYIVQKAKIRYGWVFSIENAEIGYDWGFNVIKMLK